MLIVIPVSVGVLRERAGQAYNEDGRKIDEEDVSVVQSESRIQHQTLKEPLTTACHNDLQNQSTLSHSVDRHDLDVDRHSSGTDNASAFNGAKSSGLDTEVSTTNDSVDEQWARTTP
ncbi:F7F22.13 [Arabidopsis thaliana]|uniref:F7F22.13 n=1 Tax=Arabidopsis thaliana TaxID=3702 RepID=Q9SHM7_ARATH|nr:F7F22.13 [Arabidopsis thaliana]